MVEVDDGDSHGQNVKFITNMVPDGTEMSFSTSPVNADVVFVDGMRDVMVHSGAARISLFQARLDSNTGVPVGVHTLSLAMTAASLKVFSKALSTVVDDMMAKGLL